MASVWVFSFNQFLTGTVINMAPSAPVPANVFVIAESFFLELHKRHRLLILLGQ
jgi:hypothetical protein